MTQPILCHLLVGLPGSDKSTFAQQLNRALSAHRQRSRRISTGD